MPIIKRERRERRTPRGNRKTKDVGSTGANMDGDEPRERRGKGRHRNAGMMAVVDDVGGAMNDNLSDDFTVYSRGDSETLGTLEEFSIEDGSLADEDEGAAAVLTSGGGPTTDQKHYRLLSDALNVAAEISSEKRASKRETSLRRLFKALTQYTTPEACGEAVESNVEDTILPACLYGVSRGTSAAEQYAACRCLEALSVLMGGDRDEFCEAVDEALKRAVMATGRAHMVRCAALRAMCLSNFICSTDEHQTQLLLDLCESAMAERWRGDDVNPLLRATALDCWALLSTTVGDAYLSADDGGRGVNILPLLQECLEHDSADLRSAAGECVTLIHEARLDLGLVDDDEEEDEDHGNRRNCTQRRFCRQGSWDGSNVEVLMDELRQRMVDLSVESGYHMSKKAKKEQRSIFREFVQTVVDDERPNEVVSFRGGSLTLHTWREIIQLNFIRHCLQGGFQIQLMYNPTLLYIFGADGEVLRDDHGASNMSQLEKRLIMSKTSSAAKAADVDMTRRRRSRNARNNYFITVDGEDI